MEVPYKLVGIVVLLVLTFLVPTHSQTFKVLHAFGGAKDGAGPSGPLLIDGQGNLYGVTSGGPGEYGNGTVFELSPGPNGAWAENILYDFAGGSKGAFPWGGLLLDNSGNLFGTVQGYGSYAVGGIFELSPDNGSEYSLLYSDGAGPGLLVDNIGNLYGEIGIGEYRGGAIGDLSPGADGWTYALLHSFNGTDGLAPPAPPIWDGKGGMYGVTTDGGIGKPACFNYAGCGVIFRMVPNSARGSWTYQVLHRFASFSNDGAWPYGSLVMDAAGNFYGSTWLGGKYNHGTVFKLQAIGSTVWQETPIYDFPNCLQGCMVEGTLAMDKAGNLYGTAAGGTGSCGGAACGVVFELSPQTNGQWKYTVLHYLNSSDGGVQPFYGVILDDKGDLFGVTSGFGLNGGGTAFEITP